MKASDEKMIFVYNADSSIFHGASNFVKKAFPTSSHKCRLYMLTHGVFGIKPEWKKFIKKLDKDIQFINKNEFLKIYTMVKSPEFPAMYKATPFNASLFIRSNEINQCAGLDDLMDLVVEKLNETMD